jgi:hypothetical protein
VDDATRRPIERWLGAGALDDAGPELEAAWTRLLAALPAEGPSSDFADRVMRRVAADRARARDLAPRWRWALGAGLALCGASALILPALLLAAPLPIGALLATVAGAVKTGAVWMALGVSVWRFLAEVADTASMVAATPEATAFLACFALISAAALRLLYDLTLYDWRSTGAASR